MTLKFAKNTCHRSKKVILTYHNFSQEPIRKMKACPKSKQVWPRSVQGIKTRGEIRLIIGCGEAIKGHKPRCQFSEVIKAIIHWTGPDIKHTVSPLQVCLRIFTTSWVRRQWLYNKYFLAYRLEKAMAPHSSTLAWAIPWTEESGMLQSMGLWRVGHDRATSLSLFTFMHWRRKWQPTPVFLPGESQGQRSLVGCHL